MKKMHLVLLTAVCGWMAQGAAAAPQHEAHAGWLMPLVWQSLQLHLPDSIVPPQLSVQEPGKEGHSNQQWLGEALAQRSRMAANRYGLMLQRPDLVPYNASTLPEPPKEVRVEANPEDNRLAVDVPTADATDVALDAVINRQRIKQRHWLHRVESSLHFTQAYISDNWYQGGENNVNVLGDVQWSINLNQKLHERYLFENTVRYKLGVMTARADTLRNYAINEDNFQFNSKFGYKAVKSWYYSATLQFKTQLFNTYTSNSNNLKAALLSPSELNIGLGMTYSHKDKEGIHNISLSIAPLSYNLKYCRDITGLNPVSFGIDAGHHTKHSFGSNIEAKYKWQFTPSIAWTSRLYAFTTYEWVQGDWENTFDFSVTRHLNTQLYVHLRYDKSRPYNPDWHYWQLKEILSFGLTYRFSTT